MKPSQILWKEFPKNRPPKGRKLFLVVRARRSSRIPIHEAYWFEEHWWATDWDIATDFGYVQIDENTVVAFAELPTKVET